MITCEPSGAAGGLFLKAGIHHKREKEGATGSIMTSIRALGGCREGGRWERGREGQYVYLLCILINNLAQIPQNGITQQTWRPFLEGRMRRDETRRVGLGVDAIGSYESPNLNASDRQFRHR